jgi:hypothetical protein
MRTKVVGLGGFFWRTAFALLLVVGMAGSLQATPASAGYGTYVNTDALNLRDDAGVWGNVIATMYRDEGFTYIDGPTWDGWYYIEYAGNYGYAHGHYLIINNKRAWRDGPPSSGGNTAPAATYGGEKWIDINRSTGLVTAFEGDTVVMQFWGSMGWDTSDQGFYATASGTFYIYAKNADLTWTEWGQAYIKYWMAYDGYRSNGFHSWSLDANGNVIPGGAGLTGGCVALEPSEARALYDWAPIGTRVEIHW